MSDSALPRSVFTNALNHANIDVQHAAELLELVEKLKPSEQEQVWRQAQNWRFAVEVF